MENIINQVSTTKKATFGVEIITETIPAMRKTNNPFVGRVTKVTHYIDGVLGVDYQNTVNRHLAKNGLEANYQSEAPKGKKHFNAFFYQSLNDEDVFYLKIGIYPNTIISSMYFLDGQPATPAQIEQIKTFLQAKSSNVQKQADAGLTNEQQYHIVAPKTSNVVKIWKGKQTIYQRG